MGDEKKAWKVGSKVEVHSNSEDKWLSGHIERVFEDAEGEWLVVKYNNGQSVKEIQRYSDGIRAPMKKVLEWMDDDDIDQFLDEIDKRMDGKEDKHSHLMVHAVDILNEKQQMELHGVYREDKSKYYSQLVNRYKLKGDAIEELTAKFKYLDIKKQMHPIRMQIDDSLCKYI